MNPFNLKQFSYLFILASTMVLTGCGGGSSSENTNVLTFEEFQPENQGRFQPVILKLNHFYWHESLPEGSFLIEGQHYNIDPEDFPEGLTFQIRVIDRKSAELSWLGNAKVHHVNETKDIPFSFTKEAFWAASEKAFTKETKDWKLRLQYGKGYQLSGAIHSSTPGMIKIKELSTGGITTIDISQNQTFTLPTKLEDKEPYTLQIVEHPAGQCCYLQQGDGITQGKDVEDLQIECQPAQLRIPKNVNEAFISPEQWLVQPGITNGLNNVVMATVQPDSKTTHNKYGDGALVWQASTDGGPAKFVSVYNANTNAWSHPQQTTFQDAQSIYGNGLQAFTSGTSQTTIRDDKGVQVALAVDNQAGGGAHLAQFAMGNPNHLQSAQNLQYNYNNYEFAQQDNGVWNKTILKEGNKRIIQIFVDGASQGNFTIRYNLLENFDPNRNEYNPSQENYAISIDRNNLQSDFQPFIEAKVDAKGHGVMVWTSQTQINSVTHETNLYMVEIQNHRPVSPLQDVDKINDHPLADDHPQLHINEQGDALLVWIEQYNNGSETRLTIHKQEKNAKFPSWNPPHSAESTDDTLQWANTQIADIKAFSRFAVHADMNTHGDFIIVWTQEDGNNRADLHGMLRRFYTDQKTLSMHSNPNATKIFDASSHSVNYIDADGFDVQINDKKLFTVAYQAYDDKDMTTQSMIIAPNIESIIVPQEQSPSLSFGTHGQYEVWQNQTMTSTSVSIPQGHSFVNMNTATNGTGSRSWYQFDQSMYIPTPDNGDVEPLEHVKVQLTQIDQQGQVQIVSEDQIELETLTEIEHSKVVGIVDHTGCGASTIILEATLTNGATAILSGGSQ